MDISTAFAFLLITYLNVNVVLGGLFSHNNIPIDQANKNVPKYEGSVLRNYYTHTKDFKGLDRYIIACHSTDFDCFRKQYKSLRDHVLLGNKRLGVPYYEPYTFQYFNNTCIKLAGLEMSELTGIQFDAINKEFTWTLELPFKIQQVLNSSAHCIKPDSGTLKKFTGNATIQVTYPFLLKKKKNGIHISLSDENLDVILDIPDLSHYNNESQFERNLYELSEWAYSVVQNIDAAQHFALPYTSRFRAVTELLPMRRFFLLYPDEDYPDLNFKFLSGYSKCYEKLI